MRLRGSALGVLRRLACLLEASLLALLDPGIPGEESKALERRATRRVNEYQRPGDPEPQRACLSGDAAARDPGDHVELALGAERDERLADQLLVDLVGEVHIHRPAVDQPLTCARHDPHPGDRLLTTAGA